MMLLDIVILESRVQMTTICLVRHGETDWNIQGRLQGREDVKLNYIGRNQAVTCAEYLKESPWDIIVTSPLRRAKETAFIISKRTGVNNIYISDDFIERDFGSASGLLPKEKTMKFPNGIIHDEEDWNSFKDRVMKGTEALVHKYNNKKIILVTHAGVINSILRTLSNGYIGAGNTKLKNACINIINYDEKKWEIILYNYAVDEINR